MTPRRSGLVTTTIAVSLLGTSVSNAGSSVPQTASSAPPHLPFAGLEYLTPRSENEATPGNLAEIYEFPLRPTTRARNASGEGALALAQSPFGVSLTAEGHIKYDLSLSVRGLRPATSFGSGAAYVVWITTPTLDRSEKLGVLGNDVEFRGTVAGFNKFLIVVSVERSADVETRSGPILLRGRSPSGLIQSFVSHELFNNMPHD